MTAWDRCLARRAAVVGAVASAMALVVVAATDAGGPWSQRLGMTAALAPLCGALGTLAAVQVAAARGELRALAAVGAGPWRAVVGAVAGGSAVGVAGPAAAALGLADLTALFPRAAALRRWAVDTEGRALVETTLGLRVGADGALALVAPQAAAERLPAAAMGWAMVALGLAALAVPAWVAASGGAPARRAVVGATAVAAAVVGFQGVAAGRVPAWALVVAPALVLGDALAGRALARRAVASRRAT